ncbi:hypothetical protein O3G_MSEX015034 [Manduca sexta]|uniref:PiggyBac transposable element-derived protein domain-containing protein n=1 Tax=Manduca sexta TaxID=7130 RepID=A0A921ZY40_MANSE|nr:hypothetical protein O3G_MSEX015034 [Manduca sexta]
MAFRNDDELERYLSNIADDSESETEPLETEGASDNENNVSVHSERDDIVSGSDDDDDVPLSQFRGSVLRGYNGHIWSATAPSSSRTPQRNIVNIQRYVQVNSYIETEKDAFMTLFSKSLDIVLTYTNQEIDRRAPKYKDQRFTHKTDKTKIEALIGLLFYAAVNKDIRKSTTEMWAPTSCLYKSIISESRFNFLLLCLRFDDKDSRDKEDKFAPIREAWKIFIDSCMKAYQPGYYATIDEQLGFRGKCSFRVYISSKPDKYGMKIVSICDAKAYYMFDASPYIGKGTKAKTAADYVTKLAKSIKGSGRNITFDNSFTSVPLADQLLKEYRLTCIGTLRKNKREIPPPFLPNKSKSALSSQFAFDREKTLVSFTPKVNKVILLSTMHNKEEINPVTQKPVIIDDYNATKGGVDTFDKMIHNYTTARSTRRWPLRFFFGMLDQAGVNSMILYVETKHPNIPANKFKSRFLKKLALQLPEPHMK